MTEKEIERRIELAFEAGDFEVCRCEACGSGKTDTYRPIEDPESEVKTYCSDCASDLESLIIPSDEYHSSPNA